MDEDIGTALKDPQQILRLRWNREQGGYDGSSRRAQPANMEIHTVSGTRCSVEEVKLCVSTGDVASPILVTLSIKLCKA